MESYTSTDRFINPRGRNWALFLILCVGMTFRLYGINWGMPHYFHPDERQIMYKTGDIKLSDMNPHFFAYGSLPIYLLRGTTEAIGLLNHSVIRGASAIGIEPQWMNTLRTWFPQMNDLKQRTLTGRFLSALFSTLTILVVFHLAQLLYNRKTGLLAAGFFALTVLSIQQSHYYIVDGIQTFFITTAVYFSVRASYGERYRDYYYAALFIGFAMATKISSLPIYLVYAFTHFIAMIDGRRRSVSHQLHWAIALVFSVMVMSLCMPYWILDHTNWLRDVREQANMVSGKAKLPYTIQYEHTTPFLYLINNMVIWSVGIPLGIVSFLGFGAAIARFFRKPLDLGNRIILIWVIPVFILNSTFQVKFLRYTLPLLPFFAIFAAKWLHGLSRRIGHRWSTAIIWLVVGSTALWAVAFATIYNQEDTRVQASNWVYKNIPQGAKIVLESGWDDALPIGTDQGNSTKYGQQVKLEIYNEPDNQAKAVKMAEIIESGDVIILPTKRHYGSVLRVPDRYPISGNFYRALFAEKLGFRYAASFSNPPRLGSMVFRDETADESFSVYEHPKVAVFVKESVLSKEQILTYLVSPPPDVKKLSYHEILTKEPSHSIGSRVSFPVIRWILALELLGIIVFPMMFLVFHRFLHAGYPLSKAAGLLVAGYLSWLIPSLHLLPFSQSLIILVIISIAYVNYLLFLRNREVMMKFFRERWWSIAGYELLFFIVLSLFLALKSYNPDIFWSESSMDFGFLNAVIRADYFPPIDPWIEGERINYYYFGHYLAGFLTKLSGVTANYGYNLFFATIPALVALSVASIAITLTRRMWVGCLAVIMTIIVGNLDGLVQVVRIAEQKARNTSYVDLAAALTWITDQFFMLGRPATHFRFFRSAHELINPTVHEFPFWSYNFMDLHAHMIATFISTFCLALVFVFYRNKINETSIFGSGLAAWLCIILAGISFGAMIPTNSWDYPTYMLLVLLVLFFFWPKPHKPERSILGNALQNGIQPTDFTNEIPLSENGTSNSTQLLENGSSVDENSDCISINEHLPESSQRTMMDSIQNECVAEQLSESLDENSVLDADQEVAGYQVSEQASPDFCESEDKLADTAVASIKEFPEIEQGSAAVMIQAPIKEGKPRTHWISLIYSKVRPVFSSFVESIFNIPIQRNFQHILLPWAILLVVSVGLYLPYLGQFSRKDMGIGFLFQHKQTTNFDGYFTMFGLFLFVLTTLLIKIWIGHVRSKGRSRLWTLVISAGFVFLLVSLQVLVEKFLLIDYSVFIYSSVMACLIIFLAKKELQDSDRSFAYLLAFMGFSITAGCEILFIKDFFQGSDHRRFNTIFKFYMQAWFFFAVSSAYLVGVRHRIRTSSTARTSLRHAFVRGIWNLAFLFLLGSALIFTVMGPHARHHRDEYAREKLPLTLDGHAYMKVGRLLQEHRAIQWLTENVSGNPVILEASGADYLYEFGRVSANTGFPTVLGWWSHVDQREYKRDTGKMKLAISTIYDSLDIPRVLELLRTYNVNLIYVGLTEKKTYSPAGLSKFAELTDYMTPVYANSDVLIYQVNDYGINVDFAKVASSNDALVTLQERLIAEENERKARELLEAEADRERIRLSPPRTLFQGGEGEARGQFREPRSLDVDGEGSVYVADFRNHRVQKFDNLGNWLFQWESPKSDEDKGFNDLCDIAVDSEGVYVLDTFNNRIQKYDTDGQYLAEWREADGAFFYPRSLAADKAGFLYISDSGRNRIVKMTNKGKYISSVGGLGKSPSQFVEPIGICVSKGEVFVNDTKNHRVQVFDTELKYLREWNVTGWEGTVFVEPYILVDQKDRVWISDPTAHCVNVTDRNGKLIQTIKKRSDGRPLTLPMGLAVMPDDSVLVVEAHRHAVTRLEFDSK